MNEKSNFKRNLESCFIKLVSTRKNRKIGKILKRWQRRESQTVDEEIKGIKFTHTNLTPPPHLPRIVSFYYAEYVLWKVHQRRIMAWFSPTFNISFKQRFGNRCWTLVPQCTFRLLPSMRRHTVVLDLYFMFQLLFRKVLAQYRVYCCHFRWFFPAFKFLCCENNKNGGFSSFVPKLNEWEIWCENGNCKLHNLSL